MRPRGVVGGTLLVLLVGAWVGGCETDCPVCDDPSGCPTGDDDAAAGDDDAGPDSDLTCTRETATCAAGEENIFGVCVLQSTVAVAGGTYTMGHAFENAATVGAFVIDRTEVTNAMYLACVACGTCTPPAFNGSFTGREPYFRGADFGAFPVVYVSWQQARDFCAGRSMDLPTEAQWELAARGTEERTFPWGEAVPDGDLANFQYDEGDTTAVGDYPDGASPEGVLDLAGNVWEWTLDGFDERYSARSDAPLRVIKGGSFGSTALRVAGYSRTGEQRDATASNIGFRCAAAQAE